MKRKLEFWEPRDVRPTISYSQFYSILLSSQCFQSWSHTTTSSQVAPNALSGIGKQLALSTHWLSRARLQSCLARAKKPVPRGLCHSPPSRSPFLHTLNSPAPSRNFSLAGLSLRSGVWHCQSDRTSEFVPVWGGKNEAKVAMCQQH